MVWYRHDGIWSITQLVVGDRVGLVTIQFAAYVDTTVSRTEINNLHSDACWKNEGGLSATSTGSNRSVQQIFHTRFNFSLLHPRCLLCNR